MVRTRYEAYGNTAAGTIPNGIGFTGHVNDPDTGLVYMQQRYYDPMAGRFLSVDPVVTDAKTGGDFNRYVYAHNNPHKYVDPDGRAGVLALAIPPLLIAAAHYVLPGREAREQSIGRAINSIGGRRGNPIDVKPGTNSPTTIGGRDYSGHAQDQMQGRGVPPSAVEEAIANGTPEASRGGTTVYTDKVNGVQVVVNADGKVVTVIVVERDKGEKKEPKKEEKKEEKKEPNAPN